MVSFSETKIIPKPKKAVFNAVKEALQSIGADIRTVNEKKGIIGAGVGVSVWSWGENIAIKVVAEGSRTKVLIRSESKFALIDWGKNKNNVVKFWRNLRIGLRK